MALVAIANGQLSDASQIDQFMNLLTGVMNDQVVTLKGDATRAPGVLVLDSTTAAQKVAMQFADSGAAKWQVGKDTDNSFMIWDLIAARAGLRILSNGDGSVVAPIFKTTGAANLGNPTTSRFIGAWTTAGAPTGLTAQLSDFGFDGNNVLWTCTVAGTPGTWQAPAFTGQSNTFTQPQTVNAEMTAADFKATGASGLGSAASSRYVARWTTVGAPTGLTAQVGDFGLDGNFNPWYCSAAGTPGTWKPIGSHLLATASGAGTYPYNFASIPTGYSTLELRFKLRDNSTSNSIVHLQLRFNNDSGANYDSIQVQINTSQNLSEQSPAAPATAGNSGIVAGGALADTNVYAYGSVFIHAYADTNTEKLARNQSGITLGTHVSGSDYVYLYSMNWRSTAAINQIQCYSDGTSVTAFSANSYVQLWGHA